MKKITFIFYLLSFIFLCGCATYQTPSRDTWPSHLRGVSLTDMTAESKTAKRPVYLGAGGKVISKEQIAKIKEQYGNEPVDMNVVTLNYMEKLEFELYDQLRKPGISVQRAGTDIVVILVRDALMQLDAPEFSSDGIDTLGIITKTLQKYDATFIEVAGYTDAMRDQSAARALSMDMAMRTAIFMSDNKINTARMFVVGRGAARPIAAQDDVGRLTNRRVEIRIAPAR